jgi:hypothetical protein
MRAHGTRGNQWWNNGSIMAGAVKDKSFFFVVCLNLNEY